MTDDDLERQLRVALGEIACAGVEAQADTRPVRPLRRSMPPGSDRPDLSDARFSRDGRPRRAGGRRRVLIAAVALVLVGVAGVAAWSVLDDERADDVVATRGDDASDGSGDAEATPNGGETNGADDAGGASVAPESLVPSTMPETVLPGHYVYESGTVDGRPVAGDDTLLRVLDPTIDVENGPDLMLDEAGPLNPGCGTMIATLPENRRGPLRWGPSGARCPAAALGETPERSVVPAEIVERVTEVVVIDAGRVALQGDGVDLRFVRTLASWPAGTFRLVEATVDGRARAVEGAAIAAGRLVTDTAGRDVPLLVGTEDGCLRFSIRLPDGTPEPFVTPFDVDPEGAEPADPIAGCDAVEQGGLDPAIADRIGTLDTAAMPDPDTVRLFGPGVDLTFRRASPPADRIAIVTGSPSGGVDQFIGELVFDDDRRCLVVDLSALHGSGSERAVVQWPPGYTAAGSPVVVQDDGGRAVAVEGDLVHFFGSTSDTSVLDPDRRCGASGPGSLLALSTDPVVAVPAATPAPSQSPADARRDGVDPERAALALRDRLFPLLAVASDEGTWLLGRWPEGDGGEIVLVDDAGRVVRAYPMPGVTPTWIHLTDDRVYAGRVGDGAMPDSTLVRIDRASGEVTVVVVAAPFDGGTSWPEGWLVAPDSIDTFVRLVQVGPSTGRGVLVANWIGQIRVRIADVDAFIDAAVDAAGA